MVRRSLSVLRLPAAWPTQPRSLNRTLSSPQTRLVYFAPTSTRVSVISDISCKSGKSCQSVRCPLAFRRRLDSSSRSILRTSSKAMLKSDVTLILTDSCARGPLAYSSRRYSSNSISSSKLSSNPSPEFSGEDVEPRPLVLRSSLRWRILSSAIAAATEPPTYRSISASRSTRHCSISTAIRSSSAFCDSSSANSLISLAIGPETPATRSTSGASMWSGVRTGQFNDSDVTHWIASSFGGQSRKCY